MRRLVSALLSGLLAVGGLIALAPAASAHHTYVTAESVDCVPGSSDYKITWKVQNWKGGTNNTATITSSSRGVVPAGTTLADHQAKTFTEVVGSAGTYSLQVSARWANGSTHTQSGSVGSSAFPDCSTKVTPPAPSASDPTCEKDGKLVLPSKEGVTYEQSPSGTGPGTYTVTAKAKPGFTLTGTTQWTITVRSKTTGAECDTPVTPVAPSIDTITQCDEYGSITFAETEGVSYELVEGDGRQGSYRVVATADAGYRLAEGAQREWSGDLGAYRLCVVTPLAPAVTAIAECGVEGSVVFRDVEGVSYELVEGDGKQGFYRVVATPESGYAFGADVPAEWSGDLGSWTDCAIPVEPEITSIWVCDEYGSITFDETEGVLYELVEGDGRQGTYRVVATPAPGYSFGDDATTEWSGDLGEFRACVTPVAPSVAPIQACGEYGSITFDETEGVSYELVEGDGAEGAWKVVASAEQGYGFVPGQQVEWSGDLGEYSNCATPVTPNVTPIEQCGVAGSIVFEETEGVSYELVEGDGAEGAWTVVATADEGYSFPEGTVVEWSGDLGTPLDCVEPETPVVTPIVECGEDGELLIPETEGVVYELVEGDGTSGAYEVVATPAEGYGFEPGVVSVWSGDLGEYRECQQAVSFTPPHGTADEAPAAEGDGSPTGPSPVALAEELPRTGATATGALWMLALLLVVAGVAVTAGGLVAAPAPGARGRGVAAPRRRTVLRRSASTETRVDRSTGGRRRR